MSASSNPSASAVRGAMREPRAWIALAILAIAVRLLIGQFRDDSMVAPSPAAIPEADYICRETQEVFRLRATETPAINPRTGRATLVPAVYDREAECWMPGPPLDARQRTRGPAGR